MESSNLNMEKKFMHHIQGLRKKSLTCSADEKGNMYNTYSYLTFNTFY